MRVLTVVLCLGISCVCVGKTQPWVVFGSWLLPDGFAQGYEVRDFILSDHYDSLRKVASDRETLDILYEYARLKTHGNETSAAFAMLVAVFEHRTIPLRLGISIPLSFESEAVFDRRVERLPRYLYTDTTDDRDKLQHFFSSAYARRTLKTSSLVYLLGEIVEIFEEMLVTGGANDRRDVVANRDGIQFSKRTGSLPSGFLTR